MQGQTHACVAQKIKKEIKKNKKQIKKKSKQKSKKSKTQFGPKSKSKIKKNQLKKLLFSLIVIKKRCSGQDKKNTIIVQELSLPTKLVITAIILHHSSHTSS